MDDPGPASTPLVGTDGRPHVLYVAWGFPPHRGPGTYRPLAAANTLVERGARVTVLTADQDTFDVVVGADRSLCDAVDPRVVVRRVGMPHDTRDPIVNRWPAGRAGHSRSWTRDRAAVRAEEFPEPVYVPWLRVALAAASAVHRTDPVDLTVATGNPYVDFVVAAALHDEAGVPYILDDRDSWLLDVYTGLERPDVDAVLPWFEHALAGCRAMWFVNPAIAGWHRERFGWAADRIDVVENGWDPMFLDVERLAAARSGRSGGPVLTYVGTVSPTLPLAELAEAWRRARREDALVADGELRIVGQLGHSGSSTAEQRDVERQYREDGIVFSGRVPTGRISDVYGAADALLFAKEGTGMVTSGKVYEYVATGLPVVAALDPVHDAWRVLDGHPRLFRARPTDTAALAGAMAAALREGRREDAEERRLAAAARGATRRRQAVFARAFDTWGVGR